LYKESPRPVLLGERDSVLLINLVVPETVKFETHVVVLLNGVAPDTFNDEIHVTLPFNLLVPETFNVLRLL
jgi:hypothetical protein